MSSQRGRPRLLPSTPERLSPPIRGAPGGELCSFRRYKGFSLGLCESILVGPSQVYCPGGFHVEASCLGKYATDGGGGHAVVDIFQRVGSVSLGRHSAVLPFCLPITSGDSVSEAVL